MVVLTDSSEGLREVDTIWERQAISNSVIDTIPRGSVETKEKNKADIQISSKYLTSNDDDTFGATEHVHLNKDAVINNDTANNGNEIFDGRNVARDLQEVHYSSQTIDDASVSERLLKDRANSLDVHYKERSKRKTSIESVEESIEILTPEADKDLPIDKGWAWIILLASVYAHFIVIGQLKCFGIIFVQLQQRYGSSSSATSVIFTLMNATYSISALVIMTIGGSLSARTSVFIGATISSIASMITAFIYDVNVAIVTIGVAGGVANAFIMPLIATIISTYFAEKVGFANNIGNCGVSMGAIALAPIVTKLFENFSYTGTYIILTGFNLQLLVIACLLRPMSFYRRVSSSHRSHSQYNEKGNATGEFKEDINVRNSKNPHNLQTRSGGKHSRNAHEQFNRQKSESINGPKLHVRRRRAISESETDNTLKPQTAEHSSVHSLFNSALARFASTDVMNNSMMDITLTEGGLKENRKQKDVKDTAKDSKSREQTLKITIMTSLKKLFDMKLLSKPEFQYFLVCNVFLCPGCSLASAFLPPLAYENGVSNDMVALMVSVMSIVEFCTRFVVGYISDKKWCHRSTLIAIATFILGVAAQFMHMMTTFSTIMIYAVIAGLLQGVYFSLFVVVILDILTFDNFKGALGFTSLVQGVASGVCLPIVGYLRDSTGHYAYPFNFIGATLIIGAVLTYFIPNVHEWSSKRQKAKSNDQDV